MNFSQNENETFFQCWEHFKESLLACPHHGYKTWRVTHFFYDGLPSQMHQFIEMTHSAEFMNKDPGEAWDYFDLLAEYAQYGLRLKVLKSLSQWLIPREVFISLRKRMM